MILVVMLEAMFVVQESVALMLILSLLMIVTLSWQELELVVAEQQQIWDNDYRLLQCGRYVAILANLHDSVKVIRYYRPHLAESTVAKLQQAISNFRANYPRPDCHNLRLRVTIYRQDNPDLPDFWPNYAIKYLLP